MAEGSAEGVSSGIVMYSKSISIVSFLIFADGRQLTNITLLFFPLQVDCGSGKDINATSSSSSSGNDLPWEE